MKIVIPGGSGQVGGILRRALARDGHEAVVLSRSSGDWDGENPGRWCKEIDGADVVINLAGRSVNCRYTKENRRLILESRVKSARVVGEAIARAANPPKVWLQMSTATIYSHRFDAANDDIAGILGGDEVDVPDTWRFSIKVAKAWEQAANDAATPRTRKVLMRSAVVMSPDHGGIFDVLLGLVRHGLGGTVGNGEQFVSWVHEVDFVRAVYWLMERDEFSGPVNIASPNPIPNEQFMRILRQAWGTRIALPAPNWMLELGTFLMRTESELVLKSRRVTPTRLLNSGFEFQSADWEKSARDLCKRWRDT